MGMVCGLIVPLCYYGSEQTSVPSMSMLLSLSNCLKMAPSSPGPNRTRKLCMSCARKAAGSIFICKKKKVTLQRRSKSVINQRRKSFSRTKVLKSLGGVCCYAFLQNYVRLWLYCGEEDIGDEVVSIAFSVSCSSKHINPELVGWGEEK